MAKKNKELTLALLRKLAKEHKGKKAKLPAVFYNRAGDCTHYVFEDVDDYRDRVDHLITLARARDNNRIVGITVKGVDFRKTPHRGD